MKKKVCLFFLLLLLGLINKNYSQTNCFYSGELLDSTACDKHVMIYQNFPMGSSFIIYWGDGDTSHIQNANPNFHMMMSHTYPASGVYFPYVVMYQPCLDTFSVNVYSMGMVSNQIVIQDSCRQVSGYAFVDANSNCNYDPQEGIPYALVKAYQMGQLVAMVYTDQYGYYSMSIGNSNYDLVFDPVYSNSLTSSCGTSTNPTNLNTNTYDFKFSCNNVPDLQVSIANNSYSPVFIRYIHYSVKNISCIPANGTTIKIVIPDRVNLVPNCSWNNMGQGYSVVGDTVVFNSIFVNPFGEFYGHLCVIGDTNLFIGDTLCASIEASTPLETNLTNNHAEDCSPVLVGYDPNKKEVAINGIDADGYVPNNQTMTYTLYFQNTGNAPVLNVVLKDTLPNTLNLNTFQLLDASHPVQFTFNQNELIFNFYQIMLPDSASDPAGSQGYVKFKIDQKPNLAPGTQIPNDCSIYFDYNPPIVTNTVLSIIELPTSKTSLNQSTFMVYPNPTHDKLFIRSQNSVYNVELYDVRGNLLIKEQSIQQLNLENLPQGLYILKLSNQGDYQSFKIIKE